MKFKHQREIDKAAREASMEVNEMLQDVSHKMADDQLQWLDERMKDLLRPDIYEKAKHDDCHEEVDEYFKSRRITITFIPDSMRIRIDVAGRQYAEFVPRFTIDGEPVELRPTGPMSN